MSCWVVLFIDSTGSNAVPIYPNRVFIAFSANIWLNFFVAVDAFAIAIATFFTVRRTVAFWAAFPELVLVIAVIADTSLSVEVAVWLTFSVEDWHTSAMLIFGEVLNTHTHIKTENFVFSASGSNWDGIGGNDQIDAHALASGYVEFESDSARASIASPVSVSEVNAAFQSGSTGGVGNHNWSWYNCESPRLAWLCGWVRVRVGIGLDVIDIDIDIDSTLNLWV